MAFDNRVYNFAPGPAMLPQEVLEQASQDILNWQGLGAGVMEVSHRSKAFMACYQKAIADLTDLMQVPSNYQILLLPGGAMGMNAAIPMNLMGLAKKDPQADFVVTGVWSAKSIKEAGKYGNARLAATSSAQQYTTVPQRNSWQLSADSAYVHICSNETVGGVEFDEPPNVGDVPLVADISSHMLSRVMDISKYGVLFGGIQKNIGPAGLTIVIVRKDLIGHAMPLTPTIWDWQVQAETDSMINTPPTFNIYFAGQVFEWIKQQGGVAAIELINQKKSQLLYDLLDKSSLYDARVDRRYRSRMNVTFYLQDESLQERFLAESQAAGLLGLKGHKSAGGLRASIYNAMPLAGVEQLVAFMEEFERRAA
ncbi:MAG: 3-phosphoserine/phosphohydroxythreonine transaminase [Burkholderiales bacterium]|jgi:phosphoserine aminotransferase|nr:3-phosphoserine/phosphohydroxythreonine transaminase [Burkholderiales bacterium]